jgi:two-component system sensor histidine kinase CpxA
MYSLFWRIFVSFWAVLLVAEYAAVWSASVVGESELHPALDKDNQTFVDNSRRGATVLRTRGLQAFLEWRADKSNLAGIAELFLLDVDGNDIEGRELPERIGSYLGDSTTRALLSNHSHPMEHVLTFDVTTPDGAFFVLVTSFQLPHVLSYTLTPQRIAFGVVASGIICFLLARYIAAPIVRLRQTTHALADGKLDARPPEALRTRKDEFGALAEDFDYMAERLNTMVGMQKQLLRDISHELRSPLARIHVALGLARRETDGKAENELNRIERETDRLNRLIDELIKLVRLTGSESEESTQFSICEVLTAVVNDAGFERGNTCSSIIALDHCDNALIVGNEALIYSAIENVVRNACYYAPDQARVIVRCVASFDQVSITVDDNGPGIPEPMLGRVFDPFVRVSSAREKETGGYGIGLSIARRAVQLHGGSIVASNNVGRPGLTMTITLPSRARERRMRAV